jgi:hypothetical protein
MTSPEAEHEAAIWVIKFEDADRSDLVFTGAGAEDAARKTFEVMSNSWGCYLLTDASRIAADRAEAVRLAVEKEREAWRKLLLSVRIEGPENDPCWSACAVELDLRPGRPHDGGHVGECANARAAIRARSSPSAPPASEGKCGDQFDRYSCEGEVGHIADHRAENGAIWWKSIEGDATPGPEPEEKV